MNVIEINKILDIAKKASREAGHLLKNNRLEMNKTISDIGHDIKLIGDSEAEKIIRKIITKNNNFPILGEELGKDYGLDDTFWVVDPLDGTMNYKRNIPLYSISIAFVYKNNPIIGVIYDFVNDEMYHGSDIHGAFLNNDKITVSDISHKSQGILMTGFPLKTDFNDKNFLKTLNEYKNWKKIRMIGSAALAIAYVASGKADAYSETKTNLWDVAAGIAIINAAGGEYQIDNLEEDFSLDLKISNGKISEFIC
jgi:myo-inositol-1(or 4)-monophosphatase